MRGELVKDEPIFSPFVDDEVVCQSDLMKKSGGIDLRPITPLSRFASYLSDLAFSNSDNPILFNQVLTDPVVMGV
jgi:hypothetical protein